MMVSFQALNWKTVALHVGVGMGAASFWRGAWYVLDDHLFPDQPGRSALASLLLGSAGMATSQGLMQKCEDMALQQQRTMTSVLAKTNHQRQQMMLLRLARFGAVYTVALSVVLVWRGTWIGWDVLYEHFHNRHHILPSSQHQQQQDDLASAAAGILPLHQHSVSMVKSTDPGHLTQSGIASHLAAVTILLGAGLFASVLAPPAAISVVRDATVHAAKATSKAAVAVRSTTQAPAYQGPATNVLAAFLSPSEMGASPSLSAAASTVSHHPRGAMVNAAATATAVRPAHSLNIKPVSVTQLPKATPFLVSGHLTETMKHRTRM